ncbi:hypothetical protein CTAYLR_006573 [Chrysophaeum taylorii]|uniref:Ion transport domain-containing protein n=1 Tax=Chrysophaeum taylorii TaxID=2483200 RepID=A0AAD7UMP8_9STRA|nr:hypothetical protein CTAYLR_006573 [Chrysophaeum taylorii]
MDDRPNLVVLELADGVYDLTSLDTELPTPAPLPSGQNSWPPKLSEETTAWWWNTQQALVSWHNDDLGAAADETLQGHEPPPVFEEDLEASHRDAPEDAPALPELSGEWVRLEELRPPSLVPGGETPPLREAYARPPLLDDDDDDDDMAAVVKPTPEPASTTPEAAALAQATLEAEQPRAEPQPKDDDDDDDDAWGREAPWSTTREGSPLTAPRSRLHEVPPPPPPPPIEDAPDPPARGSVDPEEARGETPEPEEEEDDEDAPVSSSKDAPVTSSQAGVDAEEARRETPEQEDAPDARVSSSQAGVDAEEARRDEERFAAVARLVEAAEEATRFRAAVTHRDGRLASRAWVALRREADETRGAIAARRLRLGFAALRRAEREARGAARAALVRRAFRRLRAEAVARREEARLAAAARMIRRWRRRAGARRVSRVFAHVATRRAVAAWVEGCRGRALVDELFRSARARREAETARRALSTWRGHAALVRRIRDLDAARDASRARRALAAWAGEVEDARRYRSRFALALHHWARALEAKCWAALKGYVGLRARKRDEARRAIEARRVALQREGCARFLAASHASRAARDSRQRAARAKRAVRDMELAAKYAQRWRAEVARRKAARRDPPPLPEFSEAARRKIATRRPPPATTTKKRPAPRRLSDALLYPDRKPDWARRQLLDVEEEATSVATTAPSAPAVATASTQVEKEDFREEPPAKEVIEAAVEAAVAARVSAARRRRARRALIRALEARLTAWQRQKRAWLEALAVAKAGDSYRVLRSEYRAWKDDIAPRYVGAALEGTPLRLEAHSAAEARVVKVLVRGGYYRWGVTFLVMATVGLAPWTAHTQGPRGLARAGCSACCCALLLDCAAQAWVFRIEWARRGWHQIRIAAILVTLANATGPQLACLTGAPAALAVAELGALRRAIASMARTVPTVAPVVAIFAGVVLVYAHVGVVLWRDCYRHGWSHAHDDVADDDDLDVEFRGGFDGVARAAWTLFVLSTTENYPFVMYPALECGTPFAIPAAIVYFVSFVLAVVYVLVAMLLAACYDAWRAEHRALGEAERVGRIHALLAAFEALGSGVSRDDFDSLAAILRPGSTRRARDDAFDFIVRDGHEITKQNFVLRCRPAFRAHLGWSRRPTTTSFSFSEQQQQQQQQQPPVLRGGGGGVFDAAATSAALHALVALYVTCEAAREDARARATRDALDAATAAILVFFAFEQIDRRSARRLFPLDAALVVAAIACRLGAFFDDSARRFAGACVALRFLALSPKTRALVRAILRVWRALGLFAAVFALAIYVYAALAVDLCAGVLPGRRRWVYDLDDDDGDPDAHRRDRRTLDDRVAFNSLPQAWENLLRLAVTNNFQDLINAYVFTRASRENASSLRRTLVGLFLVSFYVLVVWFGTNIMVALVIDALLSTTHAGADQDRLFRAASRFERPLSVLPVDDDEEKDALT